MCVFVICFVLFVCLPGVLVLCVCCVLVFCVCVYLCSVSFCVGKAVIMLSVSVCVVCV